MFVCVTEAKNVKAEGYIKGSPMWYFYVKSDVYGQIKVSSVQVLFTLYIYEGEAMKGVLVLKVRQSLTTSEVSATIVNGVRRRDRN